MRRWLIVMTLMGCGGAPEATTVEAPAATAPVVTEAPRPLAPATLDEGPIVPSGLDKARPRPRPPSLRDRIRR